MGPPVTAAYISRKVLENIQIQNGPPADILNFASHTFPVACSRGRLFPLGCVPIGPTSVDIISIG